MVLKADRRAVTFPFLLAEKQEDFLFNMSLPRLYQYFLKSVSSHLKV